MNRLQLPQRHNVLPVPFTPQRRSASMVLVGHAVAVRTMPALKAWADYTFAFILFVLAFPMIAACALLIRISSHGPVIYRQTRVGRGGKVFTIYKLRTMRNDAEKGTGPRWATPNDVRITKLGRILRALHFDELPQLWNVLKGEMSLVGPRPERPEIVSTLRKVIPGYDQRHAVKPGLTGLAQIHLPPDTSIESVRLKLVYDRAYLQRYSLWQDAKILVCTGLKVLGLKNLYRHRPLPARR